MPDYPALSRHPAIISGDFFREDPHFCSHSVLNEFLKTHEGVLRMRWIYLKAGEEVPLHTHEVDTLMIACKGTCKLTGDIESLFEEGDVVLVPKLSKHGLFLYRNEPFSGISLRFESLESEDFV